MDTAVEPSVGTAEWERVYLLGVRIDAISVDQLLSQIHSWIVDGRKETLSYANIHALNIAYKLRWFRDYFLQSRLTFCDGTGLQIAAVLTGQKLAHRFTPPDFVERICEAAVNRNWRVYFLGAKPGVAAGAAGAMRSKFPGLEIESHHGYFDMTVDGIENITVVKGINVFRPDILIVGFGMPLQEKWILDNIDSLNVKVLFPAGAIFDYISGTLPRAPRWMTDHGLEWVGRLVVEPRRLWRRYLLGNPLFFMRLIEHHLLRMPLPE